MTKSLSILLFLLPQYFSSIAGVLGPSECKRRLYGTVSNCNGKIYYSQEFTCCKGHLHKGAGLLCCSGMAYNPGNATCCIDVTGRRGNLTSLSQFVSCCCEGIAYNPLNQLCCGAKLLSKTVAHAECCGGEVIDPESQMCCGRLGEERVLKRETKDHRCCGSTQYNRMTHCCCFIESLNELGTEILSTSRCCKDQDQLPAPRHSTVCPQDGYLPSEVHLPDNPIRCDGQKYRQRPRKNQCSPSGKLYWPSEHTVCGSFYHDSPGQHCCGENLYHPETEICCNGISHPRRMNSHCCGVKPYNASDDQVKCCQGTLYNLTQLGRVGRQDQCCNNVLMDYKSSTCCQGLTYSTQQGLSCCGQNYYNTSLWSCCAGELNPDPETKHRSKRGVHNETKLEQLESLSTTQICKRVFIGTVVSVSVKNNSRLIVMTNVLQFNAWREQVEIRTSPYILQIAYHCSSDRMELGKTYIWDADTLQFFSELHLSNVLYSLHLILSMCKSS